MLIKNDIKIIRSLRLKKYRQKYNKFVIEGEKIALEAISYAKNSIDKIYCSKSFYDKKIKNLNVCLNKTIIVSDKQLATISNLKSASSVIVVMNLLEDNNVNIETGDFKLMVYLDDIMDPGNMGTLIRTCDWFSVDSLVVSRNSVDIYNPKVIQSSMGSIFRLNIVINDFFELQLKLKNKLPTYYGTLLNGKSIYDVLFDSPAVIVIGNESKGISKKIISKLDKRITIPSNNEFTESLNVAVATGIVLAEFDRGGSFD